MSKSSMALSKDLANRDRVGGRGCKADYVAQHKVHAFETLWRRICEHHGSERAAEEVVGIGHGRASTGIKTRRLSTYFAKKILDEYHRIKGEAA